MKPEFKEIDGRPCFRIPGQTNNWHCAGSTIDNLLLYTCLTLSRSPDLVQLRKDLAWDLSQLSHIRHGRQNISKGLLLDLHEFSGIPVQHLRVVANIPSEY